jgi:hypothetical protein
VRRYDMSKFVYDWLVSSIRSFQHATKIASKCSITFGWCHYALAVSFLFVFVILFQLPFFVCSNFIGLFCV